MRGAFSPLSLLHFPDPAKLLAGSERLFWRTQGRLTELPSRDWISCSAREIFVGRSVQKCDSTCSAAGHTPAMPWTRRNIL